MLLQQHWLQSIKKKETKQNQLHFDSLIKVQSDSRALISRHIHPSCHRKLNLSQRVGTSIVHSIKKEILEESTSLLLHSFVKLLRHSHTPIQGLYILMVRRNAQADRPILLQ